MKQAITILLIISSLSLSAQIRWKPLNFNVDARGYLRVNKSIYLDQVKANDSATITYFLDNASLKIKGSGSSLVLQSDNSDIFIEDNVRTKILYPSGNKTQNLGTVGAWWHNGYINRIYTNEIKPEDSAKIDLYGSLNFTSNYFIKKGSVTKFYFTTNNITFYDDLLPASSNTYDIGDPDQCIKDLYIAGSIKSCGSNITIDPHTTFTNGATVNGYSANITTKTTDYDVLSTDNTILLNGTDGTATANLPDASEYEGHEFIIKAIDVTNTVSISTSGGNIDGSPTYTFTNQYECIIVQSDGTNYYIISKYPAS